MEWCYWLEGFVELVDRDAPRSFFRRQWHETACSLLQWGSI
jgi:hypothetical protein